jgi:hypothetical protein
MAGTANQYPLLRNSVLTGIIREFKTDISIFRGAPWCPMKNYPVDTIEWDIVVGAMGMTPAVYPDAESPVKAHPAIKHKSFKTVQWREKFIFGETDLVMLRRPGTYDENYGNQMIADRLQDLNTRIETRLEYLRWAMLAGSITVTYPDAKTQVIDYEVPSGNKPTAATPWATEASADPIANVNAWKMLFRGTPVALGSLEMTQETYNHLPSNTAIKALIQYQFGYDLVRSGGLVPLGAIQEALSGVPIIVNDSGYINDSGTFVPFIADDFVVCLPKATPERWCEFMVTPHMYAGTETPSNGKFARPIWHLDDDPVSVEVVGGVYGLPVMYHADWHLYCDV